MWLGGICAMRILYAAPLQVAVIPESCCALLQEALLEERRKLEAARQKEMKGKAPAGDPLAEPAASSVAAAAGSSSEEAAAEEGTSDDGQQDALDAFMSDVQHQIEEDKVCGAT